MNRNTNNFEFRIYEMSQYHGLSNKETMHILNGYSHMFTLITICKNN